MAQNFRNQLTHTAIGTSYTDILTQVNSFDTVVGIRLVNSTGTSINVTCAIENSSNTTELIVNAPIPAGSSLELLSGGKVILETTDAIRIDCSVADKLSGTLSIMEIT